MVSSVPLPGPDASQRMDPADSKKHLGVFGFWNLNTDEQTWAVFRNIGGPGKTVLEHRRNNLLHQSIANDFYKRFKTVVVSNLIIDDSFCCGAFKETVKITSPLTDIITFVLASPVICKDHKSFFHKRVAKVYYEIMSQLKSENKKDKESVNEYFWQEREKMLEPITRGFRKIREQKSDMALPNDINELWLAELGPIFTFNYKKALAGDKSAPFKVLKCSRDRQGRLSKFCSLSQSRSTNLYVRHSWLWQTGIRGEESLW